MNDMKKRILLLAFGLTMLTLPTTLRAGALATPSYFFIHEFYDGHVLCVDDGGTPRIAHADSLSIIGRAVWAATKSSGYYTLMNTSSGKFLLASTANAWSTVTGTSSTTTGLWDVQTGLSQFVRTRYKSAGTALGADFSSDKYKGVYYNKSGTCMDRFHVVPALKKNNVYDPAYSLKVFKSEAYVNKQGVTEIDDYQVGEAVTLNTRVDYHIYSSTPFDGGSINITNEEAWVVFDNVRPSKVVSTYLRYITINGVTAVDGVNVRVEIFLDGAAVIPTTSATVPFVGYTGTGFTGESFDVSQYDGTNSDLGSRRNRMRSFKLRRGYMATVSTGVNGTGYSRVYVADHADKEIDTLPTETDQRITAVYVKRWHYTSKKGWNAGDAADWNALTCTWRYNWNCNEQTTYDSEYIPIRQKLWWPGWDDINARYNSTAVLSYNEPNHSEQHQDDGVISSSTAAANTPQFFAFGGRIGAPAETTSSWTYEYIDAVDKAKYRCDFVPFHCYWDPSSYADSTAWKNSLKSIHTRTKRPLWITEWAIGASWTSKTWSSYEEYRDAIFPVLAMMENNPWIERYAYYNYDTGGNDGTGWRRAIINDENWLTPAGEVYRKIKSTFSYNDAYAYVPTYTQPDISKPVLYVFVSERENRLVLEIENPNTDWTDYVKVQLLVGSTWQDLYIGTDREHFDNTMLTYELSLDDYPVTLDDSFRAIVTTLGKTASSTSETAQPMICFFGENVYLQNVASGTFMAAGNNWGTSAVLSATDGVDFAVECTTLYRFDSQVSNGGDAHYMGSVTPGNTLYLDGAAGDYNVAFTDNGEAYTIGYTSGNATYYLGYNASSPTQVATNLTNAGSSAAWWRFLTREAMVAEMEEDMLEASASNPVDVTRYFYDASFNRNDLRSSSRWKGNPAIGGYSSSAGANFCAEKYNCKFDVYQTVDVLPGTYRITLNGFYRNGNTAGAASKRSAGTEALNALFYANDTEVPLVSIFEDAQTTSGDAFKASSTYGYVPNDMASAAHAFDGDYYRNELTVVVTADNPVLRVGVRKTAEVSEDWAIFDNLKVYCLGVTPTYKRGDVNLDGSINVADVTALVSIILGSQPAGNVGNGDLNGDGQINVADVTALVSLILGN